ncbi:hypothetical protein [Fodinibius halophilus]|uniref:Uncharacterized protein n=1 Tax=Fodinibius halophilus TaxID=1736908 RepID=A0A6M1TAA7_9BACT|nr:hypothetical protein [Fodinibius halophilus]NGP87904.1 hypothetical protein [Fodinibius halophilus]
MSWFKDVIVDITVTATIIATVLIEHSLLFWLLWGYTGLLLLVKLIVLVGDDFLNMMNKAKTEAPKWFSHLLYAINTGTLAYFQQWYLAGAWLLIWTLSFITQRKLDRG